ncbi:hypothetical protein [Frigidibacter mobilis]|uniref:Peptidase propeptide and YPEB domain-containing protein n=1 Tax=Frigidibacter mobilis TaxID=1335048 RepID=A0A159Z898_9RHOB|nr:hypothetical protein [Frigidibacter mobilis]AMY70860.1 hypothetical protein AKL17_3636 [Frigidibacter mobilis]
MQHKLFALSLGLAGFVLAAQAAFADPGPSCGNRASVVERLAATYGETRRGIGLATGNAVVEVFASDATGTWTITVTLPDGRTCLLASGQHYEAMADALPPKGTDA